MQALQGNLFQNRGGKWVRIISDNRVISFPRFKNRPTLVQSPNQCVGQLSIRNEDRITAGFSGGFLGLVTVVIETNYRNRSQIYIYISVVLKFYWKKSNTRAHRAAHCTMVLPPLLAMFKPFHSLLHLDQKLRNS
jgi:hypothetical protein